MDKEDTFDYRFSNPSSRSLAGQTRQTHRQTVNAFADQLRDLREAHDLTQTEAGRRIGVSDATWSRWETGMHLPTPGHIRKIAQAFPGFQGADMYLRKVRDAVARDKLGHRMKGAAQSEHAQTTTRIGEHTVELLHDGSLRVNGNVIHIPP